MSDDVDAYEPGYQEDVIARRTDAIRDLLVDADLLKTPSFKKEALSLAKLVRATLPLPRRGELITIAGGKEVISEERAKVLALRDADKEKG
jgi:hypothetical protein